MFRSLFFGYLGYNLVQSLHLCKNIMFEVPLVSVCVRLGIKLLQNFMDFFRFEQNVKCSHLPNNFKYVNIS